jgi:hypothetical protein
MKWLRVISWIVLALAISGCGKMALPPFDPSVPPEKSATLEISGNVKVDIFDGKEVAWSNDGGSLLEGSATVLIPAGKHKLQVSSDVSKIESTIAKPVYDEKGRLKQSYDFQYHTVCGNSGYCLNAELEYEFQAGRIYRVNYGDVEHVARGGKPTYQPQTKAQRSAQSTRFPISFVTVSQNGQVLLDKHDDYFDFSIKDATDSLF